MDHCAHLQYVDETIPVHCGETTLKIIESLEPNKEHEALGVHPFKTFRIGDKITVDGIEIEPVHLDHSIPGAYGFIIHASSGSIVYTGDYRMHGPAACMTKEFVEKASNCDTEVLITEGTRLGRKDKGENLTEEDVRKIADRIVSRTDKLVITTFYSRDVDRIKTFYRVAKDNDRKFIISMKTAHLLNKLKDDKRLDVPNPLKDENILVYARRKKSGKYDDKDYYVWERQYLDNAVGYKYIQENYKKCLLNLDLYSFTELVDIKPRGGEFIHSMSEPFTEGGMDQIEQEVMLRWLEHFKLRFHQVHASGHIGVKELKTVISTIKPRKVIPIHTENPKLFGRIVKGVKIEYPKVS
jgi:ribonuclease J